MEKTREPKPFKRGMGPLVSVLIPTRKRPKHLLECVDSLWSLAIDKSLLEFVFKVDDDDEETIRVVQFISRIVPSKAIFSLRGRGYLELGTWARQMSEVASGDWIFLFNDDARIATQGWDQFLLYSVDNTWHGTGDVMALVAPTIGKPFNNEFLFLRHETFKILGHWDGTGPYNDNWIYHVMDMVGSVMIVPIFIRHFHEECQDEVRKELVAAMDESKINWNNPEGIAGRIKDSQKLLDYINDHRLPPT